MESLVRHPELLNHKLMHLYKQHLKKAKVKSKWFNGEIDAEY